MTLVRLSEQRLPEIMHLERKLYSNPWTEDNFRGELNRPFTIALGWEQNHSLAGYCFFWLLEPEAHLLNLAVARAKQGRGLGRRLLLSMFEIGLAAQVKVFLLEVRAGNAVARHLYKALGFVEVGRRLGYYQGENEDAVLMSCSARAAENSLTGNAL